MSDQRFSSAALTTCLVCDWLWCIAVIGGCAYVVFWRDASGWWFLLAIMLAGSWNCKRYRSPEQIAADPPEKDS